MPYTVTARPAAGDYNEYFNRYLQCLPDGDLVAILEKQITTLGNRLAPLDEVMAGYSYAPGKWTIREVVGHLTDTERVFSYRATAFSRADDQPLPGFDQALWNPHGSFDSRRLPDLLDEWATTRRSSLALLKAMPALGLQRRGTASGNPLSVLACFAIVAGHVNYHLDHLRDHYGVKG